MRRIVIWLASTVTIVVLLFGYHTSTSGKGQTAAATSPATTSGSAGASATPTPSASAGSGGGGSPDPTPSAPAGASSSGAAKSYTGDVAQTRWGPVQVEITTRNGKITDVQVVQYPNGNGRDQEINSYAIPVLVQDTLTNQNGTVDMISGATVTTDGYIESLQSALDKAGR
jgi:uncharacterized protein with FMN-binding domain